VDRKKLIEMMDKDAEKMEVRITHMNRLNILMSNFKDNVTRIAEPSLTNWIYLSVKIDEVLETLLVIGNDMVEIGEFQTELMDFLQDVNREEDE